LYLCSYSLVLLLTVVVFIECYHLLIINSSVFLHFQGMHQQLHLKPYAVHTTFQYAGTEGKRNRLREAMLFVDQPSYYDTPGLFICQSLNV
jgi:hypothetical protein